MPIITPSRKFEGGEMAVNIYGQTIKTGIRVINFRDNDIKANGVQLFILPPFKVDAQGNGVWYKVFKVRDNFGLDTKERFAVQPNCPVDYFAAKAKLYFPQYAEIQKQQKDGKDIKVYPSFGRTAVKVLFNTAFCKNPALGAHILEVPQFGCASVIDEWTRSKDFEGNDAPLLNNWEAAIPVEFKIKQGAVGNPWQVIIHSSKTYKLPEQLADSDYLYNLDDVVSYQSKDELIEKLKRLTPSSIFNKCMSDYSDGSTVSMLQTVAATPIEDDVLYDTIPVPTLVVMSAPVAKATGVSATTSLAPVFNAPKAAVLAEVPKVATPNAGNPIAGVNMAAARAFLKK